MTPEELNKACEFLQTRLFPTVKVQKGEDIDVIDRWELIDEFRKAMTEKKNPLFEECRSKINLEVREEVRRKMELASSLIWQDVRRIVEIADMLVDNQEPDNLGRFPSMEAYYSEVLRRFNSK